MTISELGKFQYQVAGCVLESSIPFPELTVWEPAKDQLDPLKAPDLRIVVWQPRIGAAGVDESDVPVPAFLRTRSYYQVQSTTGCTFAFDAPTATVWATRPPEVSARILREAFLADVFPLCLAALGHLLLHASGVALDDGRAVVFAGKSGAGKSTLAAFFGLSGATVLADDYVRIVPNEQSAATVYSTFSRLQLFKDSHESLDLPGQLVEADTLASPNAQKRSVALGARFLSESAAFPLAGIFALKPGEELAVPHIERLNSKAGFLEVIKGAFIFDTFSEVDAVLQFEVASKLASQLPIYQLSVPRHYEQLPAVYKSVCQFLAAET